MLGKLFIVLTLMWHSINNPDCRHVYMVLGKIILFAIKSVTFGKQISRMYLSTNFHFHHHPIQHVVKCSNLLQFEWIARNILPQIIFFYQRVMQCLQYFSFSNATTLREIFDCHIPIKNMSCFSFFLKYYHTQIKSNVNHNSTKPRSTRESFTCNIHISYWWPLTTQTLEPQAKDLRPLILCNNYIEYGHP